MQSHNFRRPSGDKSAKIRPLLSKAHRVPSIFHGSICTWDQSCWFPILALAIAGNEQNRTDMEMKEEMKEEVKDEMKWSLGKKCLKCSLYGDFRGEKGFFHLLTSNTSFPMTATAKCFTVKIRGGRLWHRLSVQQMVIINNPVFTQEHKYHCFVL